MLQKAGQSKMNRVVQNYLLKQKIGFGQYGNVYKAEHKLEAGLFAVKVMSVQMFKAQPKLSQFTNMQMTVLTKIDHPNIIKFKEMLKTNTNFYLIYEFCDGGTLSQLIKHKGKIPEEEALLYFQQIRNAYHALFQANILHRDLKPTNILFKNGVLKLADFGFCKELLKQGDMTQTIVGSPIYMAPQILRDTAYDSKADIWSLGVILYQMLYGVCPYEQNSIPKLLSAIQTCYIKFPEEPVISENIKDLIRRTLTITAKSRIGPLELMQYNLHKQKKKKQIPVNYQLAGKYLRRAFIYLSETLQMLTNNVEDLNYLRLAFLLYKIINSMQQDSLSGSLFWQNLKIDVSREDWDKVMAQQSSILQPFGTQTCKVLAKQDTSLKTKVELQTNHIDAKYFLQCMRKLQDAQIMIRLYNCLLYNRHFCLIIQKRPSEWTDPQSDGLSLKQKAQILYKYARYY